MSVIGGGSATASRGSASPSWSPAAAGSRAGWTAWTGTSTTRGSNDSGLTMRPSELFQRECWISFGPVEGSLSVLADYIGPHKIL